MSLLIRVLSIPCVLMMLSGCMTSASGPKLEASDLVGKTSTIFVYQRNLAGASDLFVDGKKVGMLDRNSYWAGKVVPGRHEVQIVYRGLLSRKKTTTIVVSGKDNAYVKHGYNVGGFEPVTVTVIYDFYFKQVPNATGRQEIIGMRALK